MDHGKPGRPSTLDVGEDPRKPRRKANPKKIYRFKEILNNEEEEFEFVHPSTSQGLGLHPMSERGRMPPPPTSPIKSPTKRKADVSFPEAGIPHFDTDMTIESDDDHGTLMWIPKDHNTIALDRQDYQPVNKISRTVHLKEYFEIRTSGEFIPTHSEEELKTGMSNDLKGVWFRTGREAGHNKHGNVKFIFTLNTFLNLLNKKGNFKFYFYEIYQSPSVCTSRFIIAEERDFQIPGDLVPYDSSVLGGPWHTEKNDDGVVVNRIPSYIRKYKSRANHPIRHEVEFFLKAGEEIYRDIFLYAHPIPQDHSEANDGDVSNCPKYRSGIGGNPSSCSYPLSKSAVTWEIEEHWTVGTFSTYITWVIQSQLEEKLLELGCSEMALQQLGNDIMSPLLRVAIQKASQMFEFTSCLSRDEKTGANVVHHEDDFEKEIDDLDEVSQVISKYVSDYVEKLKNYGISEQSLSFRAASGKLEIDLGEMMEEMSQELGGMMCDSFENLAVAMKFVLKNETDDE